MVTNLFISFRICLIQLDRSQFAPTVVILNPSTTGLIVLQKRNQNFGFSFDRL